MSGVLRRWRNRLIAATAVATILGSITVAQAQAWSGNASVKSVCASGEVQLTGSFKNTEPPAAKGQPVNWNDMDVTMSYQGLKTTVHTVVASSPTDDTFVIKTGVDRIAAGSVKFDMSWTNAKRGGTDSWSASFSALDCRNANAAAAVTVSAPTCNSPGVASVTGLENAVLVGKLNQSVGTHSNDFTAANGSKFAAGPGVSADGTTKTVTYTIAAQLSGDQCAVLIVVKTPPSATAPTCTAPGSLVLPAVEHATWKGGKNGDGPGTYTLTLVSPDNGYKTDGKVYTVTVLPQLDRAQCLNLVKPVVEVLCGGQVKVTNPASNPVVEIWEADENSAGTYLRNLQPGESFVYTVDPSATNLVFVAIDTVDTTIISDQATVTANHDACVTTVPVPPAPSVNDLCNPYGVSHNATWNVPANTAVYAWNVDANGHLIVTVVASNTTLPGGAKTHDYGVAPDSGQMCSVTPVGAQLTGAVCTVADKGVPENGTVSFPATGPVAYSLKGVTANASGVYAVAPGTYTAMASLKSGAGSWSADIGSWQKMEDGTLQMQVVVAAPSCPRPNQVTFTDNLNQSGVNCAGHWTQTGMTTYASVFDTASWSWVKGAVVKTTWNAAVYTPLSAAEMVTYNCPVRGTSADTGLTGATEIDTGRQIGVAVGLGVFALLVAGGVFFLRRRMGRTE